MDFATYDGYPDNRVLSLHLAPDTNHYQLPASPKTVSTTVSNDPSKQLPVASETDNLPDELIILYFKGLTRKQYVTPGVVWIFSIHKYMDEVELPNIEWQHFLNYLARDSGQTVAARYLPQASQLPRPDYSSNPFYRYYPVTGISREQVEAYCRWRSVAVTKALADLHQFGPAHPNYMVVHYRLPTEAEWEAAAGSQVAPQALYGGLPTQGRLQVNPKAAAYLRTRFQATQTEAQVRQDILAFNKATPKIVPFNCQRQAPYFLALPTPGYVFDLPQNFFGLYQMAGNVAELVLEPGLTKGGSYRDSLAACAVKARGHYAGPAPDIGFRCVCEVSFPNRQ